MRLAGAAFALLAGALMAGCHAGRTLVAPSGDLADYRAFRVAAAPGTRLARAAHYLDRHPHGVFADEVQDAFDREEAAYFARAQTDAAAAREYLADLPRGPHADAAVALLRALGSSVEDAELQDIATRVRHEDVRFEFAAEQRRRVGEAVLGAVGAVLDDGVFGSRREELPPAVARELTGPSASTWGSLPLRRDQDLFFWLPTRPERESRLLTLSVVLSAQDERVTEARVEGQGLFATWAEADRLAKLDASRPEDLRAIEEHAMDRLGGALERRFPVGACEDRKSPGEWFHRACGGWEARVVPSPSAGGVDSIVVRGPSHATKGAP